MALRKPIKVEVLEELQQRLELLSARAQAVGWQRHEVYEAAFFFGLVATDLQVARCERDAEVTRNAARRAQHLTDDAAAVHV